MVCVTRAALLAGCGGGTDVRVQGTTTISKGQELSDLQRALNDGAITQKDYESLRAKIMKRPD
jgi:cell division protein FtsX